MRRVVVSRTNAGDSNAAILDYFGGTNVSIQVDVLSGTPTWTVQQTLNDVNDPEITPVWYNHPDTNMVSQTVGRQSNYSFVPMAAKLVVTGTGVVRLILLQAGAPGDR
jgi:hypothetical protein